MCPPHVSPSPAVPAVPAPAFTICEALFALKSPRRMITSPGNGSGMPVPATKRAIERDIFIYYIYIVQYNIV